MQTKTVLAIVGFALMVLTTLVPFVVVADSGSAGSRNLTEQDNSSGGPGCVNNDDFPCAEPFFDSATTLQQSIDGKTGVSATNPVDVYKIVNVKSGMVINASMKITNSAGFKDRVVVLEIYNTFHQERLAWSESGFTWEAATVVAIQEGTWYIRASPAKKGSDASPTTYTLTAKAEYPELIDLTTNPTVTRFGTLSNQTYEPAKWYRIKGTESATTRMIMNVTASFDPSFSGTPPVCGVCFDLYLRDLQPDGWSWWHNVSWWGEWPGWGHGSGASNNEEAEMTADYRNLPCGTTTATARCYYADIHAWNGSGPYQLTFRNKGTVASDGDNDPEVATQIVRVPGQDAWTVQGHVNQGYDKYDWYKFDLKDNETISATLFLKNQKPGVYRIGLFVQNASNPGYNTVRSETNYRGGTMFASAKATVINTVAQTYFVGVNAQIALNPSNFSNLADWHVNIADADYTLQVDLPHRSHPPQIAASAPSELLATEDTDSVVAKLSTIYTDQDVGDPELQDAISYTVINAPEHVTWTFGPAPDQDLHIIPEADWSGQTYMVLRGTDRYGDFAEKNFTVRVTPANDAPITLPAARESLSDFWVKEGEVNASANNISLTRIFSDADLPYGDSLTYTVSGTTADASVAPKVDKGLLVFAPAKVTASSGQETFLVPVTITATDTATPPATSTFEVNVTVVAGDGEILFNPDPAVELQEEGQTTLDLNTHFKQSRGKVLTYEVVKASIPRNLTVSAPDSKGITTIKGTQDFYTDDVGVPLTFKAWRTTISGIQSAEGTLQVVVKNVPDGPHITNPIPDPAQVTIKLKEEKDQQYFAVTVVDVDTPLSKITYAWYVDDALKWQAGASYTFAPDFDSARAVKVKVVVKDETLLSDTFNWDVTTINTNRPPTVTNSFPTNNSELDPDKGKKTAKVNFVVDAKDPDGDALHFEWFEGGVSKWNEDALNSTAAVTSTYKAVYTCGSNKQVYVKISDPSGDQVIKYIVVSIKKCAGGGSSFIPGFEAGTAIVASVAALGLMMRRRRET